MSARGTSLDRVPLRLGLQLGAGAALLLVLLELLGAFRTFDQRLHDLRYRLRGPVPASPRIALVEVDDRTVAAYHGAWPLPRETYALLIDALEGAGAQAIGYDMLFLGENAEDSTGDQLLAAITHEHDNVVHAISFLPEDATLGGGGGPPPGHSEALIRHGRPVSRQRLAVARQVALPYDALLQSADGLGHTAVVVDNDGVIRRIPEFVRYGDWAFPSLAIRLVECAARRDSTLPQFEMGDDGLQLHWNGRRMRVPSDAEGATAIAFAGDRSSFTNATSMLDVLHWYRDRDTTALARAFRGRLVLVGATAVEQVVSDVGATPYAEAAPLVFVHANAVNAALQGRFLAGASRWAVALAVLLLGLALGALLSRLPLLRSALVAIGAMAVVGVVDFGLFALADLDVPPAAALLLPPVTWIAIEGVRRTAAERRARERERELQVARTIQQQMLPSAPPAMPGLDVFGANLPAEAVGGDYFDWIVLDDDTLAVAVGDVTGHGVPAAILMAHLRASFHAELRPGTAPNAVVEAVNRSLSRAAAPGKFATFFLAIISRGAGRLAYCNAGHNPPLLLADGRLEPLEATGIPLAMMEGLPYAGGERPFAPGSALVIYSDGIPEAPVQKDFYGDERLRSVVGSLARSGASAADIGRGLLDDVRKAAGEGLAADDVTVLVVRRG